MIYTVDKEMFKNIWNDGIITFDTCSMGRMYEWEYNNAINIKDVLSYLFANGHLWETEYNCEEFNVQREEIKKSIFQQKYENSIFKHLKKRPIPWSKIDKTFHRWEGRGYNSSFIAELDKLRSNKTILDDEIGRLRLLAQNLSAHPDADDLFDSILGESDISLSEETKAKSIERYNSGIVCPGSCDKNKHNGKQYNDLFIWELLKKKAYQSNKDVIFVTSDTKSDWFLDGSPRLEYIKEFQKETDRNIMILTLVDFWECCQPYIDLPIEDFILQSSILTQLQEKYDDCYEQQICNKVEELIFESNEITSALEDSLNCCVDTPVIDQIENCSIDDVYPSSYEHGDEFVPVTIEMTAEITFNAQNYTSGEYWSAGSDSILFNIIVLGSIPVKWSSEDTRRIVLKDSIIVNEIVDAAVVPESHSDNVNDGDKTNDYLGHIVKIIINTGIRKPEILKKSYYSNIIVKGIDKLGDEKYLFDKYDSIHLYEFNNGEEIAKFLGLDTEKIQIEFEEYDFIIYDNENQKCHSIIFKSKYARKILEILFSNLDKGNKLRINRDFLLLILGVDDKKWNFMQLLESATKEIMEYDIADITLKEKNDDIFIKYKGLKYFNTIIASLESDKKRVEERIRELEMEKILLDLIDENKDYDVKNNLDQIIKQIEQNGVISIVTRVYVGNLLEEDYKKDYNYEVLKRKIKIIEEIAEAYGQKQLKDLLSF